MRGGHSLRGLSVPFRGSAGRREGSAGMSGCGEQGRELMAGQLGIWYAQQLSPDTSVFNIGEYLEIVGDLDTGLFEAALRRGIVEADALSLRFREDGEAPRQHAGEL